MDEKYGGRIQIMNVYLFVRTQNVYMGSWWNQKESIRES